MPFINGKYVKKEKGQIDEPAVQEQADDNVPQTDIPLPDLSDADYMPNYDGVALKVSLEKKKSVKESRSIKAKPFITIGLVICLLVMLLGIYATSGATTVLALACAFLLSCAYFIVIPRK